MKSPKKADLERGMHRLLLSMAQSGVTMTDKEWEALKWWAQVLVAAQTFGVFTNAVRNGLIWLSGLFLAYVGWRNGLLDIIGSWINRGGPQ